MDKLSLSYLVRINFQGRETFTPVDIVVDKNATGADIINQIRRTLGEGFREEVSPLGITLLKCVEI